MWVMIFYLVNSNSNLEQKYEHKNSNREFIWEHLKPVFEVSNSNDHFYLFHLIPRVKGVAQIVPPIWSIWNKQIKIVT